MTNNAQGGTWGFAADAALIAPDFTDNVRANGKLNAPPHVLRQAAQIVAAELAAHAPPVSRRIAANRTFSFSNLTFAAPDWSEPGQLVAVLPANAALTTVYVVPVDTPVSRVAALEQPEPERYAVVNGRRITPSAELTARNNRINAFLRAHPEYVGRPIEEIVIAQGDQ